MKLWTACATFIYLGLLFSCKPNVQEIKSSGLTHELDSLLKGQTELLNKGGFRLEKKYGHDSLDLDTLLTNPAWEDELKLVSSINLDKVAFRTEYNREENGSIISYIRKKESQSPVSKLILFKKNNHIDSAHAELSQNEILFASATYINVSFEKAVLKNFSTKGWQKVSLHDTLFYQVNGRVLDPDDS